MAENKKISKTSEQISRKRLVWGGYIFLFLCIIVLIFAVKWWFEGTLDKHLFASAALGITIIAFITTIVYIIVDEFFPKSWLRKVIGKIFNF